MMSRRDSTLPAQFNDCLGDLDVRYLKSGSGCSGADPKTMTSWFLCPQSNSKEKSEEHTSCKLTSVEAEEGQGTSGEAEKAKNSAQGTKRKRDTKNSTGKRATVPQIVFPWV